MTTLRLTELQLAYFRGATNRAAIQFDASKPIVVVFGENGTGKSTIVDALDLIANGRVGSLEDRSSARMSHAPAIGRKPADVIITLMRGAEKWQGTFKGTKPQVTTPTKVPAIDILRRSQLLQLVEAVPTKRYEALQRFIDVSGVEASEFELDRAVKSAKQEITSANNRAVSAATQLAELWTSNGKPYDSWKAWAATKSAMNTKGIEENITMLTSLVSVSEIYTTHHVKYESELSNLLKSREFLDTVLAGRDEVLASWTEQTPKVIETLTAAEQLLDAGWADEKCPVCQQQIAPQVLKLRVAEALKMMKALKIVCDRETLAHKAVETARLAVANEKAALLEGVVKLLWASKESEIDCVVRLQLDFEKLEQLAVSDMASDSDFDTLISASDSLALLRRTLAASLEDRQRDKHQLHTIQTVLQAYNDSMKEAEAAVAIHRMLDQTHKQVRASRIKFVQDILDEVSTEADRLYQIIHPNENAKAVRFALDEAKRASLNQYGEFAGHADIEPQGYYSDSHLDTLGFCLWMALAKRSCSVERVIVLDDVFASVGAAHLGRIIELLDSECDHFAQVFIFTHNRNWFDRYRFNQAVSGKAHKLD